MKRHHTNFQFSKATLVLLLLFAFTSSLLAQTTTATIRGKVTNEGGSAAPGAEVSAVSTTSGFTHTTTARADGSYTLAGLTPGSYTIVVSSGSSEPRSQEITVQVGQTLDADFQMGPQMVVSETITVLGTNTLVETRTSQVATNVTRHQIENLPQSNRNFLNFAGLAPGVRVTDDEFKKQIVSGAQPAQATNVFIDGVSFKSDVLPGGVIGQDSSRGNPFPQNAVQEFRVVTQNFSAEYQKASSAIITAVTKSGSNRLTGDAFVFYQDKDFVARNDFAPADQEKPAYERLQGGLSVGGPIIRDKMHFFLSYEGNDQDRENVVRVDNANFRAQFAQFEGVFVSPFREDLVFGKLSFQPSSAQLFDFSGFYRKETDIRSFGGTTSRASAENVKQDGIGFTGRHQLNSNTWLNEASLSYNQLQWNPQALNTTDVGLNYQGVIRIGGRSFSQNFDQKRISFRDDLTFSGAFGGAHTFKVGGNVDQLDYDVQKLAFSNPEFQFRQDIGFDIPFEALYGLGNPDLSDENTQFGVYAQDSWIINTHFSADLGIRWDYETDMVNNGYVTPADVRTNLSPFIDSNYFTDGGDREAHKDLFQPRLGVQYDVFANGRTIAFAGAGRYYDRVLYNEILDERLRLNFKVGLFRFSRDGQPRDGQPTVIFKPEYLTPAGLDQLRALGITGKPEVFLIENDTKVPQSDHLSVGIRQTLGSFYGSLTYANIRSKNGYSYIFGTRNAEGNCCVQLHPDYANVLLSTDDKKSWYNAVYLTLDRPYSPQTRWGVNLAYTYSDAEQNGGDLFSLDFPTVSDYPRYPVSGIEDHRVVLSGTVGIPWETRLSSLITYGSGVPFNIADASRGFGPTEFVFRRNAGESGEFRTIDLRLDKDFVFGGYRIGATLEAFNIEDHENFGCYNDFIARLPEINPNFGKPGCLVEPGRRLQAGLRFGF